MSGLFDTHVTLLEKSLDFRARRNALLAGNVANLETPGYQAKDLVFETTLANAMAARTPGPLQVTNSKHMDGRMATPLQLAQPELIRSGNPVGSLDGNTVELEKEMGKLAENQVHYQALIQMMSHKLLALKTAIREGGSQ